VTEIIDIHRAAKLVIDRRGEEAVEELQRRGDPNETVN
jgi:hypothetical protein